MKEQDMRAVEGMVRCGIDLEGLWSVFGAFPKEEVEKIYLAVHESCKADGVDLDRKINCSYGEE